MANRNLNTVTDQNGVYVLPGLLGSGETNVIDLTIANSSGTQSFEVILDPNQQNLKDFTFAPTAPTANNPSGPPTISNPKPGTPVPVKATPGTTTVVNAKVTVPKVQTPVTPPPPPPPEPAYGECKLHGAILSPGDGLASTNGSVTVTGYVSDLVPASTLTLLVNGIAYPIAALTGGQFSVPGVTLARGNNSLLLATTSAELLQEGCLPSSVPAGPNLVPISTVSRAFYDPSAANVAAVVAARGFDTVVSGRLIDSDTNLPVAGLTIQAIGLNASAVTNADGAFQLKMLNAAVGSTGTTVQSIPDTGLTLNVTQQ